MSIRKELTAQNVLLGFQHVLVSNVWLDPVFVAGAIGLPIALSSNMINAIFIVSGLVTWFRPLGWFACRWCRGRQPRLTR